MVSSQMRFNPLHNGSLVATGRFLDAPIFRFDGFNPLHNGSLVATSVFWSSRCTAKKGFNPLHNGSLVATLNTSRGPREFEVMFQSPS